MYTCYNCKKQFVPKFKPSNPNRPYCSRSCSAKTNNSIVPKRRRVVKKCRLCNNDALPYRKSCGDHIPQSKNHMTTTVGEFRAKLDGSGKHPSWVHAEIRGYARLWNAERRSGPCQRCGYDLHVEVCHIKAISSYPDTATLGEINAPENILILCRNCHWEFDNGHLLPVDIPTKH